MYEKIKVAELPKRKRRAAFRFESTPEWRLMKADIDKGLKPLDALQVIFTEADKDKHKIHDRRSIAGFIKKYLAAQHLPYTVTSFERRETGDFVILVKRVPALRQRSA